VKMKVALLTTLFVALSSMGFAQSKTKEVEPNVIVKNLYSAQAAGSGPFFQTKDRAVVDKYFTKELADLIWKDAVTANGEVGAIDFDPLYGSQDPQVSHFTIMETGWGGDSKYGPADEAVVQVTFKDSDQARMVSFQFKQGGDKNWKIYDVHYRSADGEVKLAEILTRAATPPTAAAPGIRGVDFLNHSYQGSVCSEDVGLPKTVEVSGGKFKAGDNYFEVDKNEIAYGDVDGDGGEDAVVYIRCGSAAGTLRAFEVHAYSFENGQAKLLARLDSIGLENDYRKSYAGGTLHYAGEHGPKIVNGHVIVEALADGSFARPENVATFDYQLSGGKFVLSGKPARTKRAP
jgi:Protein of unknown function (DUF3828)